MQTSRGYKECCDLHRQSLDRIPSSTGEPAKSALRSISASPEPCSGGGNLPPLKQRILLGVGTDGHTASLFPHSENGLEGDQAVVLTESPVKLHQRMSLSLPLINKAQQVFVLVMGKGKHDITTQISRVGREPRKWPISGVNPSSGQLVWYVDYEALLG